MKNTTTIEITDEQKAQLDDLKASGQSYKGVIDSLIEGYSKESGSAIEYDGDIRERLDSLESAVKEATQAAQAADRKLEELQ